MNQFVQKSKTSILTFLVGVMAFLGVASFSTPIAYAKTGADAIDVTVSKDGQINVKNSAFDSGNAWTNFIRKYKNFIVGISGIGAVSMILFFIINLMKLGGSTGNPQARQQALTGVLWTGIATAGLGSVAIITGFFYGAFK